MSISLNKYTEALSRIKKVQSQYADYKKISKEKAAVVLEKENYQKQIKHADFVKVELEKRCDNCYHRVMTLLGDKQAPYSSKGALPNPHDFEQTVTRFSNLAQSIALSGGTEEEEIRAFKQAYADIKGHIRSSQSGSLSTSVLLDTVEREEQQKLANIEVKIAEQRNALREILGFDQSDINSYRKMLSEESSIFTTGIRFREKASCGIKLGSILMDVSDEEQTVISDIYPEFDCQNGKLAIPYVFPTNDPQYGEKANIYIEYDPNEKSVEQASIAIHQIILKMISENSAGALSLHGADLTETGIGRFLYINTYFEKALSGLRARDSALASLLSKCLCHKEATDREALSGMVQEEFEAVKKNERQQIYDGFVSQRYLYTYWGYSSLWGAEINREIRRVYMNSAPCAALGIHNIFVVSKKDIQEAKQRSEQRGSIVGSAEADWLDTLQIIKDHSHCFSFSKGGLCEMADVDGREIAVRLGDVQFSSLREYETAERELIETIKDLEVNRVEPFIDMNGAKEYDAEEISLGRYANDDSVIPVTKEQNIIVIFGDNSFDAEEKSRIMSSLLLAQIASTKPGQTRLSLASSRGNEYIMNVISGLEGEKDGIKYSLLEGTRDFSFQDKLSGWSRSIEEIGRTLIEKKRNASRKDGSHSKYDIYDLLEEDPTKHLRLVYDEYRNEGSVYTSIGFRSAASEIVKLVTLAKREHCGMQCLLSFEDENVADRLSDFKDSSIFEHVIVARDRGFFDHNNRRMKLSVLTNKDEAHFAAEKILAQYIENAFSSPSYEEIGFGSHTNEAADAILSIPVGRKDGVPFSMDFDCLGSGLFAHMVQGTSGSGKSALLFSLILNGAMKYSPDALNFYLLDFKDGTSFDSFRNSKHPIPHIKQLSVKNDAEDADTIFSNIEGEKLARSMLFKRYGVHNISEYNQAVAGKEPYMPRIIVIIDECQEAFGENGTASSTINDDLANRFSRLMNQVRAYGIHFVLTTQKISSGLFNKIGSQINGRCSFKMSNHVDAESLLAKDVAMELLKLPRYGVMLYSNDAGRSAVTVQVAHAYGKIGSFAEAIRSTYSTHTKPTFELGNGDALRVTADAMPAAVYNPIGTSSITIPLGKNCMREAEADLVFRRAQNQSLLLAGENEKLAANLIVSMMCSAMKTAPAESRFSVYSETLNNRVVSLCRTHLGHRAKVTVDADALMEEVYWEIIDRRERLKNAKEGETIVFDPWFVALDNVNSDILEETRSHTSYTTQKASPFNALPTLGGTAPEKTTRRELPEKHKLWQTVCESAGGVGIYLFVYIREPGSLPRAKNYFHHFNHLITFPCNSLLKSVQEKPGIELPFLSHWRHSALTSKLPLDANVCYYVTEAVDEERDQSEFYKIHKIRPYNLEE